MFRLHVLSSVGKGDALLNMLRQIGANRSFSVFFLLTAPIATSQATEKIQPKYKINKLTALEQNITEAIIINQFESYFPSNGNRTTGSNHHQGQ